MALISTKIIFELVRGLRKGVAKWGYAIVCWYENCLLWANKLPGVYNEDISGGEEEYSALYPLSSTLSPLSSGCSTHAFSVIRFVLGPVTVNAFNWHMSCPHRATVSVMGFWLIHILPNLLPCNWRLFRLAVYMSEHLLLCILGAVAKNAFELLHIRLSVRMYQRGCRWTDFHEIWYYEKSAEKTQIGLKSDSNMGHIAWRSKYVLLFAGDI